MGGSIRVCLLFAAVTMGALVGAVPASATFSCSATGNGGDFCTCKGADNCAELRKSGSCKGSLDCKVVDDVTKCTCDAKISPLPGTLRVVPPKNLSP